MLSNTLNTNEIKDSTGTEKEFSRLSTSDRSTEFAAIGESPARPHRLSIAHTEVGEGIKKRRRSVVRINKTVLSDVDTTLPVVVSGYCVLDAPVGALTTAAELAHVMAELNSFLSTTGAATAVLFDGTGNGTSALLNGSL